MAADMMDRNQRDSQGQSRRLGKVDAHKQGPDEAWSIGHRDGVQICTGDVCLLKSTVRQGGDDLNVFPRGDFRYYAPVDGMHIDLAQNAVGENFPPVPGDGNGGFVAGAFNSKDQHEPASFQLSVSSSASSVGLR